MPGSSTFHLAVRNGERVEGTQPLPALAAKTDAICHDAAGTTPVTRRISTLIAILAVAGALVSSVSLYHHYGRSETSYCDFGENFTVTL